MATKRAELSEKLAFDPDWVFDPAPYIYKLLDKEHLMRLAEIQLSAQREMMAVQIRVIEETLELVGKQR